MPATSPLIGRLAPSIELKDQHGHDWVLPATGVQVLFFFPKAFTAGCTRQMTSIRDSALAAALQSPAASGLPSPPTSPDPSGSAEALTPTRVTLVTVSRDPPELLAEWQEHLHLPGQMVMLSDPDGGVGKEYGITTALLGLATTRKTVIVLNGVVVDTYVANVDVRSHVKWVEKRLKSMQAK